MASGQQHAPDALYPWERTGTHFTGGWVGPRADLNGRKISSPPEFDPGTSSPYSVAIPNEIPGRHFTTVVYKKINKSLVKFQVEFVGWMQTKLQPPDKTQCSSAILSPSQSNPIQRFWLHGGRLGYSCRVNDA